VLTKKFKNNVKQIQNKGDKMKLEIILAILLIFVGGCTIVQNGNPGTTDNTTVAISGTQELVLNAQDLEKLGMAGNGTDCVTEEYETGENSPLAQNSVCYYRINSMNGTEVTLEMQKFTNLNDLNGSYQYSSLHYRSAKGLISENDFGDQSRLYVNNEEDYGGQYNEPGVYYYHLYYTKDKYLIHITSSGRSKEAVDYIRSMGRQILAKFG
jgi:hypothetical protein